MKEVRGQKPPQKEWGGVFTTFPEVSSAATPDGMGMGWGWDGMQCWEVGELLCSEEELKHSGPSPLAPFIKLITILKAQDPICAQNTHLF